MNASDSADPPVGVSEGATQMAPPRDRAPAIRAFVVLDLVARLVMWSASVALATAAVTALGVWPERSIVGADLLLAWDWALCLSAWIVLFNVAYVVLLVVLRLPIPAPQEGRYPTNGRGLPPALLWSCLLALLTKARYGAPFPGFLVFHLANLPPLRWLMEPIFGPRSRSCTMSEPRVVDPHLVTIGRNVVIGAFTSITGHYQDRDAVVLRRTIIEDNVVIGGDCALFGGVHVKSGSMIGAGAIVLPGTVVGPNEFWAGVPARKIRDLPPTPQTVSP